jgi:hypothetical protein
MDYYIQSILGQPECVKSRLFDTQAQEICRVFLIVLEDYLRYTHWSTFYNESTSYTCFEIFKDYYEDINLSIDRERLFKVEEEVWKGYLNSNTTDKGSNPNIFHINNFRLNLNFLNYDLDWNKTIPKYPIPEDSVKIKTVLKKQLPIKKLKETIKFTKRENIDKKLLRKFKKFLKELYKKKALPPISDFWYTFIKHNLFPPVQYTNDLLSENINFKSFNTNYLLWLFGHSGGTELYDLFLENNRNDVVNMFLDLLKCPQDINELRKYIDSFAVSYSCRDLHSETVSTLPAFDDKMTETHNEVFNTVFDINK